MKDFTKNIYMGNGLVFQVTVQYSNGFGKTLKSVELIENKGRKIEPIDFIYFFTEHISEQMIFLYFEQEINEYKEYLKE